MSELCIWLSLYVIKYKEEKRKIFDEIVNTVVQNVKSIKPNRQFKRKKKFIIKKYLKEDVKKEN